MTSHLLTHALPLSQFHQRLPRLGIYARVMIGHYLWHIQVVFAAVLGVVTAINISKEVAVVWSEGASASPVAGAMRAGEYVLYRLLDNGSQVFPIVFVLGIVWAEITHARSGRFTIVRTAGMSFRQASSALLVLAVLSVPVQFLFDNVVRPFAFMSLSYKGLGEYGRAYARERADRNAWLSFDGDVVQVRLHDDPEPKMADFTFYEFSNEGDLTRITDAPIVVRGEDSGDDRWELQTVRLWDFGTIGRPSADTGSDAPVGFVAHDKLDMAVALSPLWLEYRSIAPKYIPLADLTRLANERGIPDNAPRYWEWLHIRIAQAFTPGLLALCVSAVFFLYLDRRGLLQAAVLMVISGYLGFSVTRVMAVLAEYHVLPALLAIWALPVIFLLTAISLFTLIRLHDRRYEF